MIPHLIGCIISYCSWTGCQSYCYKGYPYCIHHLGWLKSHHQRNYRRANNSGHSTNEEGHGNSWDTNKTFENFILENKFVKKLIRGEISETIQKVMEGD
jgi:hypothetical protein